MVETRLPAISRTILFVVQSNASGTNRTGQRGDARKSLKLNNYLNAACRTAT
jgi:hypothetical protein